MSTRKTMSIRKTIEEELRFRDLVKSHYRIPCYIPKEQVFKYLEGKGVVHSHLRRFHDNQLGKLKNAETSM